MRLIDADALKQVIEDRYESARLQVLIRRNGKTIHEGIAIGMNFARNAIIDQAAVDAVQVVRCKDCANIDPEVELPDGMFYCNEWNSTTRGHWYCCRGEKEEED